MEQNNAIWTSLLKTVLDMPGIRVNRDEFLKDKLEKFCPSDKLELAVENPVKMVPKNILDKIANKSINNHTTKVTSLSAATGIIADTTIDFAVNTIASSAVGINTDNISLNTAQYYWHALVLAQKLAYIYGFPTLDKLNTYDISTVFSGVMLGNELADQSINKIAESLAGQPEGISQQIDRTAFPDIAHIEEWIEQCLCAENANTKDLDINGIITAASAVAATAKNSSSNPEEKSKTKKGNGKRMLSSLLKATTGNFVNIEGCITGGVSTFATFRPCAKRLQNRLAETMNLFGKCEFDSISESDNEDNISPEKMAIMMLINAAKVDRTISKEEKKFIDNEIKNTLLNKEEQEALEASFDNDDLFDIDYTVFENDIPLLEDTLNKIKELVAADGKVSLVEKMHLRKLENDLSKI